jgi:hypothetical protein
VDQTEPPFGYLGESPNTNLQPPRYVPRGLTAPIPTFCRAVDRAIGPRFYHRALSGRRRALAQGSEHELFPDSSDLLHDLAAGAPEIPGISAMSATPASTNRRSIFDAPSLVEWWLDHCATSNLHGGFCF